MRNTIFSLLLTGMQLASSAQETIPVKFIMQNPGTPLIFYRNDYERGNKNGYAYPGRQKETFDTVPAWTIYYQGSNLLPVYIAKTSETVRITKPSKFVYDIANAGKERNNEQQLLRALTQTFNQPTFGVSAGDTAFRSVTIYKGKSYVLAKLTPEICRNMYEDRLAFIEKYTAEHPVSPAYKAFLEHFYFYSYLAGATTWYLRNGGDATAWIQPHLATINTDAAMDNILQMDSYRAFLELYVIWWKKQNGSNTLKSMQSLATRFEGAARDQVMYALIFSYGANMDGSTNSALAYFNSQCRNPVYTKIINHKYTAFRQLDDIFHNETMTGFSRREVDFLSYLKQMNNKVLVIDLWATWCKPCRKDLPHYEKLISRYKKDPVQFIFIAHLSPDWEKVAKQYPFMNAGNCFLVSEPMYSKLKHAFSTNGIPAGILINKGTVQSLDLPRAEDEELKTIIDQCLLSAKG